MILFVFSLIFLSFFLIVYILVSVANDCADLFD